MEFIQKSMFVWDLSKQIISYSDRNYEKLIKFLIPLIDQNLFSSKPEWTPLIIWTGIWIRVVATQIIAHSTQSINYPTFL